MSSRAEAFEDWIRTSFVQMNTELENIYFAQENRAQVIGCGDPIKGRFAMKATRTSPRCSRKATPEKDSTAPLAFSAT